MPAFQGSSQWDHVRFSGTTDCFKSELYVYGANHGQFNTVWGRSDSRGPKSWFLNLRPLLSGADQRKVAKVYVEVANGTIDAATLRRVNEAYTRLKAKGSRPRTRPASKSQTRSDSQGQQTGLL